ncbi:hypothetical protein EYR40_010570 [Pleurotus pulmonarius]|nr:hypothetical protein EYR36_010040 [Pleurotus pulmonarius]KAF4589014.1 hypothetical protein EYR40_010570 [Pleurotus pulmonarius]
MSSLRAWEADATSATPSPAPSRPCSSKPAPLKLNLWNQLDDRIRLRPAVGASLQDNATMRGDGAAFDAELNENMEEFLEETNDVQEPIAFWDSLAPLWFALSTFTLDRLIHAGASATHFVERLEWDQSIG